MNGPAKRIQATYLAITLLSTLAASFIWGINTLFLLDAGLSNTEAFAANAFFTVGQVLFEVPTGAIADMWGRRTSYLLGVITLIVSTLLYYLMWQIQAGMLGWAVASILIGLGFTFFSGAVEAWLVDSLHFTGYKQDLDPVFAKGQIVGGVAMLTGSVAGGIVAQFTDLGVPYLIRSAILGLTFIVAWLYMKDLGFKPDRNLAVGKRVRVLFSESLTAGLKHPPVRWVMLAAPFSAGVGIYVFYALQPYLLELYGDPNAYSIAGLTAALVAGAQVVGGLIVPWMRKVFRRRTTAMIAQILFSVAALVLIGLISSFWLVVALITVWALLFAAVLPIRQAYLNALIPSKQRATVLSFDALMGSAGGVVVQPTLGKVADVWGYGPSYVAAGAIQLLALPFTLFAHRELQETARTNKSSKN